MFMCCFPRRSKNGKRSATHDKSGFVQLKDTDGLSIHSYSSLEESTKIQKIPSCPEMVHTPTIYSSGTSFLRPYFKWNQPKPHTDSFRSVTNGIQVSSDFEEVLMYGFLLNDGSNTRIPTLYISLTPALVNL
ncbi:hypothetical protein K7432_003329 [Basidiobolus ranarum]|uniref:Uncharacterized protein n=1 Tax=Basidiobolus ranarum TaxID=34480 RepID=A0ABR2W6D8_9FUNG